MNKTETANDRMDRLERRIVATLDAAAQPEPSAERRLDQARALALESPPRPWRPLWLTLPLTAAAAVAVLALTLVLQQPAGPEPMPMTADADLLTLPEFDWLIEDPELAAWLLDEELGRADVEQSG